MNMKRLIVLLLVLAACGGSSSTAPATPATLVGTYVLTAVDGSLPAACFTYPIVSTPTGQEYDIDYLVGATLAFDATTATLTVSSERRHQSDNSVVSTSSNSFGLTYTRTGDQLTIQDGTYTGASANSFIYPADSAIWTNESWCRQYPTKQRFDFRRQ